MRRASPYALGVQAGDNDVVKKKNGTRLPPLTSADITRMLRLDGWAEARAGRHPNWKHPTKPGKVQLPENWTGVKTSHDTFKGLLRQTGWTKADAIRLYWASRG
jgi:predicted RNA binding protein YcfA (HicA-like mRNA interferase family)